MNSDSFVPSLMLMTLVVVLLLAIGQLVWFLRKRRNRALAKHALEGDPSKG